MTTSHRQKTRAVLPGQLLALIHRGDLDLETAAVVYAHLIVAPEYRGRRPAELDIVSIPAGARGSRRATVGS